MREALKAERDRLLQLASHEDGMLQSYRSLVVTVQSILVAAGAALVSAAYEVKGDVYAWWLFAATLLILGSSKWGESAAQVWLSRKEWEVDYLHQRVLRCEAFLWEGERIYFELLRAKRRKFRPTRSRDEKDELTAENLLTQEGVEKIISLQERRPGFNRAAMKAYFSTAINVGWVAVGLAGLVAVVPESKWMVLKGAVGLA